MKVFRCDHCRQLVFFENVRCVSCNHQLAYLSDLGVVGSLEPAGDGLWKTPIRRAADRTYRLCRNYTAENVCNWAVRSDDPHPFCPSCRLTRVIPDLSKPGHREAWYRLEVAKRRLVYTLLALKLPVLNRTDDPDRGLAFEFLSDPEDPTVPRVLTGHAGGVITVNLAEADDAERERRRHQFHEPYRTLLGHFRHESGHYYWDRLIRESDRLVGFRGRFGDDRADYAEALARHHADGPPADWQSRFVSAYASSHPWEDWAETWTHYLHMTDALETAAACGVRLRPPRPGDPTLQAIPDPVDDQPESFEELMASWFPLTYVLNNLNRGLGLTDAYPFVLTGPAIEKLRFVHDTVWAKRLS
ncbi:MAG TPA: putative zinc-binding peptidase [Gemmataceae bacterium]|nr:putative zinc-binding peptidase [Gemmataceae bacterium]